MLRLLECGVVAARAQIVVVVLIGMMDLSLTGMGENRVGSLGETLGDPAVPKWVIVVVAAVTATAMSLGAAHFGSGASAARRALRG